MSEVVHCLEVTSGFTGYRLDRYLADALGGEDGLSRAKLQALIKSGNVTIGGRTISKPRHALEGGESVVVTVPPEAPSEPQPEAIPLTVIFEDEYLIVVDKPVGMVVHPGSGNAEGTLVNALLHHCDGQLSRVGDAERPGIVHRLDKETSGCLVAAKTDAAHEGLVAQFSGRETRKVYRAVTAGVPDPLHGHIENRTGRHPVNRQKMAVLDPEGEAGKLAITDYEVIAYGDEWAQVRCKIHTGRTHQIRVHLSQTLRCPILGDEIYATVSRQSIKPGRMMLHAHELGFRHPVLGEALAFKSELPREFDAFASEMSQ